MANGDEGFSERLRNSVAIRSLSMEQSVYQTLLAAMPAEIQYPYYYADTKTEKIRELDARAEFHYESGIADGVLSIEFLIECKDIVGSHIIFSGPQHEYPSSAGWGSSYLSLRNDDVQDLLLRALRETQLPYPLDHIRRQFQTVAYQKDLLQLTGSKVWDLVPSIAEKTAFRETTIGSERDLDSSVLWKSMLALQDAKLVRLAAIQESIETRVVPLRRYAKNNSMEVNCGKVIEDFKSHIGDVSILYPMVVVRAGLHMYRNGGVEPVDHVRLRIEGDRFDGFWVDVVRYDEFSKIMKSVFRHYNEKFPATSDDTC